MRAYGSSRFITLTRNVALARASLAAIVGIMALVVASALLSSCASLQLDAPDASRDPDEVLSAYVSENGGSLPGVAASVVVGGHVAWSGAYGVRTLGSAEPVDILDPFHIGSDTKAMTALLCAKLVERGLLAWDATVGEVLGSVHDVRGEYRDVTLAMLLSHTGGFPAGLPMLTWSSFFPYDAENGRDRAALTSAILAAAPANEPGTSFVYSNLGYVVAGRMAEVAAGDGWEALMRQELFDPLGMVGAGFGPPAKPIGSATARPAPWGHSPRPVDPSSEAADNPAAIGPAGTVHATLADLERYVGVYLSGGLAPDGSRLVSEATIAELLTPRSDAYALGWGIDTAADGRRIAMHDGSNTMFYCTIAMLPDDGGAIVVMTNRGDSVASVRVAELALYLAERFLGVSMEL